jgi:DNA-binding NarL/FixJ family response regulator
MLVEDQVLLREGLAGLFRDAGHEVVGSYGAATGLAALVGEHKPGIVVLDIRLPPTYTDEGTRAAADIKTAYPQVGVLLLSQHLETAHTVDLVARGGFGYLLKDRVLDVADFLAAVERVARGGSALDPHVVGQLLHRTDGRSGLGRLTEREHDVLRLMAQGYTNAGVARRLFLSERTVEAHMRRLLTKLDIDDAEDAHRRVLAVLTFLRSEGVPRVLAAGSLRSESIADDEEARAGGAARDLSRRAGRT